MDMLPCWSASTARTLFCLLRQDDSGAYEKFRDAEIKCFMIEPEITHRDWKRKRLEPPLLPEEAAQYSFRDLQVTLYYKIEI